MENNLKFYRKLANMSQKELAESINVTRQTISLIEVGKYNPTINLCIALCKVLNTDLNSLFLEEPKIKKHL
ncbi:helix-turn-helix transcriptional regulator [Staphylococcus agnetis]|uniref:helix-turn-helix transcriptional regulator n=1 Tax=Staphylococcus agnetis TaxID=985762 RepID=UPI00208E4AC2|nr:helix-turn-helix transcriptional regulator [Staphylococcus agnetis]MCO4351505.1 helix-turn-helix transcriptional regulator [Staphylococcus agnetis]MCO4360920.1 helix-turn-helix transcriptional regulator [Staphylococcus agnetis]MCO4372520.1 helix-turn-helix transcriptional regulator [Staphylococcus agnetis]